MANKFLEKIYSNLTLEELEDMLNEKKTEIKFIKKTIDKKKDEIQKDK